MLPHPDPHPNLKTNLILTGTPCQPPPTAWTLRAPVLFLLQQLEGDVGNESGSVGGGESSGSGGRSGVASGSSTARRVDSALRGAWYREVLTTIEHALIFDRADQPVSPQM